MTVEELIKELQAIENKNDKVFFWEEGCKRDVTEVGEEENSEVFILSR